MTPEPILELSGIGKSFSGISVLRNIDLSIYPGEVHCIVGENGAGKSTLIKIISGAYQRDQGEIRYQGKGLDHFSPGWARENGINTIYQEIDVVPNLSAQENIFLGIEPLSTTGNINWRELRREAQRILSEIGADINMTTPVANLKLAHQQMVAIAKALILKSKVIILDEPSAVFTSSEIEFLFNIIRRLKAQDIAILYISHHLDEIFEIGDRITVLRDGDHICTGYVHEFDKDSLVKAMVGREIDFSQRNGQHEMAEELLAVKNLTRDGIVEDVSFSLHRGEIVGVAGLVGAGRSEMARMLIGADHCDGGEIYLAGKQIRPRSPQHALSLGIGMVPEDRKQDGLVLMRSCGENLSFSMIQVKTKAGIVPWRRIKDKVNELIQVLHIRPANANIQVQYMSGGNQQKVVLGKWLAAGCDVLILDEPTRGVDVGARSEIYDVMQQLKQEGKAVLMVSSDMTEILTQSDRILIMARGRIMGELAGSEATEEEVLAMALQLNGGSV